MKGSGISSPSPSPSPVIGVGNKLYKTKPPFRPAQDDTKPPLQDPIRRSDPIETEEPVLRLPPNFPPPNSKP
ncbi:hypothetical protein LINGRAHAP2_LOCUS3182 [Linum grandiflorum]